MPAVNITAPIRVGWKPNPLERGSFELLWTCLATILACTFAVFHLNVPGPKDSFLRIFFRKFKWMIIAALGPEIVTGLAMGDLAAAQKSTREMRALGCKTWTMTHSFFANMGGFVVYPRGGKPFPATTPVLVWLIQNGHLKKRRIRRRVGQIKDHSKADGFSKGFACLQALWLVADCILRVFKKLPISELELATCAFVGCMLITYSCWWLKPKDVEATEKIRIKLPPDCINDIHHALGITKEEWDRRVNERRIENYTWSLMRGEESTFIRVGWIAVGIIFNVIHGLAWKFSFPTTQELWAWRIASIVNGCCFVWILFIYLLSRCGICNDAPLWIWGLGPLLYLMARLVLIVQMFACLRSLPVGVYQKVNWADVVPHL